MRVTGFCGVKADRIGDRTVLIDSGHVEVERMETRGYSMKNRVWNWETSRGIDGAGESKVTKIDASS